jgi:hypothetical protein
MKKRIVPDGIRGIFHIEKEAFSWTDPDSFCLKHALQLC